MQRLHKKLASLSVSKSPTAETASQAYIPDSDLTSDPRFFYRYRKQRGVNLGSWFVLERWIADSPFRRAAEPGQSDHDVARGTYAKGILEEHYRMWIEDEDWEWLRRKGVNAVRIPIGYYHLCGLNKEFIENTEFEPHYQLFDDAWFHIRTAVEKAHEHGIGVLIDLHAAPGKQNKESHSGSSSPSTFFSKSFNQAHANAVLEALLRALNNINLPNVIGIELLNEPAPPNDSSLQKFYDKAIETLAETDTSMPLYLGECWRPDVYADYISKRKKQNPEQMLVLDHHLYRCFTSKDIKTPVSQHEQALRDDNADTPRTMARVSGKLRSGGADIIVGEWSAALNPGSLQGATTESQRKYVDAQLALFEKYCAGNFFWTYKKQVSGDKGWSLRDAVHSGTVPRWLGGMRATRPLDNSEQELSRRAAKRDTELRQAHDAHVKYWSQFPGKYEHHRFAEGFGIGWNDSYVFFGSAAGSPNLSVPEIGFRGAWARRRTTDWGKCYWEFEHGFNQGADAAKRDFEEVYCS